MKLSCIPKIGMHLNFEEAVSAGNRLDYLPLLKIGTGRIKTKDSYQSPLCSSNLVKSMETSN